MTWARRPKVRDYPIHWQLYEINGSSNVLRSSGTLNAKQAEDWRTLAFDVSHILDSGEKWFSLVLEAPADISDDRSIGFPIYKLTPQDVRSQPATIDGVASVGVAALKLRLSYASSQ